MSGTGPPKSGRRSSDGPSFWSRLAGSALPGVVRRNYALKFALALLIVVLLIATIGVVSYVQIQEIIEEDAEKTLRSTATVQADAIGEWVGGMESQTRGIATSDVYGTRNTERIRAHLQDSKTLVGSDIVAIHYVDPAGEEIVASTDASAEGRSVASTPTWREPVERAAAGAGEGGRVESSDRAYERNGQLLVAFARPVRIGDGVLVVVADVRQGFERFYGSETIATTTVLNADGHEVAAPRQSRATPLADTPAFADAREGETTIHGRESDVVAFAAVDDTDWIVAAEAPTAQLYAASDTVGRNVVFLVVSTLAALTAVGIVLGRGTVLPLIRLRERTWALESGDFDVDLRTNREDEIGRLFDSFAQMRDALREQIRETDAARERAERSSRELARQNERLDQFASTVSHDLRNPLNVADGYRDLLATELEATGDGDPEKLRQYVTLIGESHDRMGTIIDDVLALARGGKSIDDPVQVDLEAVVAAAWSNVEHGDASLEVVGTRTFEADRTRLLRVFENLFRNAVEHGGPEVTVEVGPTEAGTGFYVADDGSGIPPDVVNEVFEYGQTTAEGGTGFGLAIVEAIVTAHGWTIVVDEPYDGGAKFVVSGVGDEFSGSAGSSEPGSVDGSSCPNGVDGLHSSEGPGGSNGVDERDGGGEDDRDRRRSVRDSAFAPDGEATNVISESDR